MKKILLPILLIFSTLYLNAQTLNNIEAVEYDASQNRFLISNGNSIIARASNGDLSFFSTSSATHGMEVLGNHLFAIDGSTIRGIELDTETEVMALNIVGASFLNGMTTDGDSTLFATDFSSKKIYKINVADVTNPSFETIVNNTSTTPNGVVYDDTNYRLIFVNWGNNAPIKAVNLMDNSVSTIVTTSLGNIDGIDEDNDGNYYIASWSPDRITKYDNAFANPPETITTPFLNNPADICYAKEIDTLAIPHYPGGGDEVVYIGFSPDTMSTNTLELAADDLNINIFPNPISEQSVIQFKLEKNETISFEIWSQDGKLLKTLLAGEQMKGKHTILLSGINLTFGNYWLHVKRNNYIKNYMLSFQ